MIRHVVLFQFSSSVSREKVREVIAAIQSNARATEGMIRFEGGENIRGSGLHQGFTHCFTLDFIDEKARDTYLERLDKDETCWQISDITVGGLGGILSMNIELQDAASSTEPGNFDHSDLVP